MKDRISEGSEYRIAPNKPRRGIVSHDDGDILLTPYKAIQLTPEVIQALEDAGVEI